MAARRLSAQFLTVLQRSSVGNSSSLEALSVPRQGSFFAYRGLHSEAQARADNEQTHHYEKEKMVNEGGGSAEASFESKSDELRQQQEEKLGQAAKDAASGASQKIDEAKETVKEKSSVAGGKASEATDQAKGQVDKNVDTAKDMFKDFPQKMSETASGLKEVGVEAAKAVKRDSEKLAQKAGLKTD
ncbi:unnamed protein product [Calypogeia fissa]